MNRLRLGALILPLVGLLCLPGCNDEEKRAAERIKALERQLADRRETVGAVRVVAFVVLAGGAVAGLCYLGGSRSPGSSRGSDGTPLEFRPPPSRPALPAWNSHQPVRDARVIDLDPAAPIVPAPPARSQRRQRRRHRSRSRDPYRDPYRNPNRNTDPQP